MRSSSSLPRLPPVEVRVGTSTVSVSGLNESRSRQRTSTASPFSTPTLREHADASQPRRTNISNEAELTHAALGNENPQRSSSYWANKFQSHSKTDFVFGDVAPLLERFEDTSLYRHPPKSLQSVLDEMNAKTDSISRQQLATMDSKRALLPRQASDLITIHRHDSLADMTEITVKTNYHERVKVSASAPPAKVVPTRFLFDGTRCQRAARCDYCNLTGGELECATCNVVAHAHCYLTAYEREDRKTKLTFVVPATSSFASWLCSHCQLELTIEYDEKSAEARAAHLASQRQVLANALTAYVRMMKDATVFATKKAAIIRIQAILRGRQARQRFERLQRLRLKPYAIDGLRVRVLLPSTLGTMSTGLGLGINSSSGLDELRLGNGFSCNPFLYVTVVAGNDEDTQLFCFETSVRKPTGSIEQLEMHWPEKMFVPGADGNATFCFTLVSKNGPNTFFLGQAVLRLLDLGDCWRTGLTTELEVLDQVEIFPKTAQHQPLALAEAGGKVVHLSEDPDEITNTTEARMRERPRWLMNVHLRPFGEQHSHCGYLNMKSTLDSFHTSARWCVLADGILRIYRHFGVTLASDIVNMAHATEVRIVPRTSTAHHVALKRINLTSHRPVESLKTRPPVDERCCLMIHHLSRLYLFQCEHKEQLRVWLKKLQGAQKFSSFATHSSLACAILPIATSSVS